MTVYFLPANQSYLEAISDYLISNHLENFTSIKVIVPNTMVCASLQHILIKNIQNGSSFLPNIIPISSLSEEGDFAYKMPSDAISMAGYLEQKLLLIDIIKKYNFKAFNLLQASYLSDKLIKLFYEFEYGEIDIKSLAGAVELDSQAHWIMITNFLIYAYEEWKIRIKSNKKINPIEYQKISLKIALEDQSNITILVGVMNDTKFVKDFIKRLAHSDNGIVILPPFHKKDIKKEIDPLSPLYKIKELLKYCDVTIDELVSLPTSKPYEIISKIEYIKADDILEEAEIISLIAANIPKNEKVGIVTNNDDLINLCSIALLKYGINLNNLRGLQLVTTKHAEFALLLAETVFTRDIIKFTALLKTPFLISEFIYKFEMNFLRKSSIDTIDELQLSINEEDEDATKLLNEFIKNTSVFYNKGSVKANFKHIVSSHIDAINNVAPGVFAGEEGLALKKFFLELVEISSNIEFVDVEFYPSILKQLLSHAKFFPGNNSNIFFLTFGDAALLEIDRVIIADCNDGSIPKRYNEDPWMNNKIRKAIGLASIEDIINMEHYYFYLLLNKKEVFITRSCKNLAQESRFLTEFLLTEEKNPIELSDWNGVYDNIFYSESLDLSGSIGSSANFPSSISATNIELLVRNPYIFYAKNILKLKKIDDINREPSFADFGTLVHNIIALYTEEYKASRTYEEKSKQIINIANNLFYKDPIHKKARSWWQKLINICHGFIEWDEKRRDDISSVYSEIYGETILSIGTHNIKVTAIADRIEITKSGDLQILDYKTGAVPSKQDVLTGLAPQLIVEAIIALEGGFNNIKLQSFNKIILTYVKISGSKQSYNETSIEVSLDDLLRHKEGLIKLISYYANNKIFPSTANSIYSPRYNNYDHLERSS